MLPWHQTSSTLDLRRKAPFLETIDNIRLSHNPETFSLRGPTLVIENSPSQLPSTLIPSPRDDASVAQKDITCDLDKRMHLLPSYHCCVTLEGVDVTRGWQTGAVCKPRLPYMNRGRRARSCLFPNSSRYPTAPPPPLYTGVSVWRLTAVRGRQKGPCYFHPYFCYVHPAFC